MFERRVLIGVKVLSRANVSLILFLSFALRNQDPFGSAKIVLIVRIIILSWSRLLTFRFLVPVSVGSSKLIIL